MSKRNALALAAIAGGAAWLTGSAIERLRLQKLAGLNVAITGGSRGLGFALARVALAHGARVAVCARDDHELAAAIATLQDIAPQAVVIGIIADVTNEADARRFVGDATDILGGLDVLVNNAGTIQVGPWREMTERDYEESIALHVLAPLHTCLAAYSALRQSGGRIVNISSIGGKVSVPHLLPYSVGKFALVGLSRGLACEFEQDGICVTTVCPGLMRTGSPRNAWFKGRHREEYTWFSVGGSIPLLTISADAAARRILAASMARRRQLVFPLAARAAVLAHELAPELTATLLSVTNRLLPPPGGVGTRRVRGAHSTTSWSPSFLTVLTERAAEANNQLSSARDHARAQPNGRHESSSFRTNRL